MQKKTGISKWINHKTFGILISILFLFLIFHNINLSQFLDSIKSFNVLYAIPAIFTYALSYLVRSIRWKELLSVSKNINYWGVVKALYIGYMANTLLPARMGEIYRAHILGTEQNIKRSAVLASIIAERIFDGLTLFSLLVILILFFHNSTILLEICITTGLIFVTGFILIVIVSRSNKTQSTRINKIISILPKKIRNTLETMINAFIKGFKVIHSTKALVIIILTSIAAWFLEWATMYLIVSGFTLNNTVSPLTVAFLVVLVAFSTMIPSGPAFVGPYQYAFILALDLSSITKDASLAVAVTTQFIMVAPVVIIGMLLLWHSHFSMKDINEKENTIEETPDIEVQQ